MPEKYYNPNYIESLKKQLAHYKDMVLKVRNLAVYWRNRTCPDCHLIAKFNEKGVPYHPVPFYNCPECITDIDGDTFMKLIEKIIMKEIK